MLVVLLLTVNTLDLLLANGFSLRCYAAAIYMNTYASGAGFFLVITSILDLSQKNCQVCFLTMPQSKASFQCLYFVVFFFFYKIDWILKGVGSF